MSAEKMVVTYLNDDGDEIELPAKYEVCPTCRGKGTHVNPAIDGHGLTREDFDEDPDFEEAYFRGDYNVPCEECKGTRVVLVPNEPQCDKKALGEYHDAQDRAAQEHRSECITRMRESGCLE